MVDDHLSGGGCRNRSIALRSGPNRWCRRLKRISHITLPGLKSASIVVLILSIGSILGGGLVGSNFEQSMLLGNTLNSEKSQIIQTYAFRYRAGAGKILVCNGD